MNENTIYGHRQALFVSITVYSVANAACKIQSALYAADPAVVSCHFQRSAAQCTDFMSSIDKHISNRQQIQLLFDLAFAFIIGSTF